MQGSEGKNGKQEPIMEASTKPCSGNGTLLCRGRGLKFRGGKDWIYVNVKNGLGVSKMFISN